MRLFITSLHHSCQYFTVCIIYANVYYYNVYDAKIKINK